MCTDTDELYRAILNTPPEELKSAAWTTHTIGIYPYGRDKTHWNAKVKNKTWTFVDLHNAKAQAAFMHDMVKRLVSSKRIIRVNFPQTIPSTCVGVDTVPKVEIAPLKRHIAGSTGIYHTIVNAENGKYKVCRKYQETVAGGRHTLSITVDTLEEAIRLNHAWHEKLQLPDRFEKRLCIIDLHKHKISVEAFTQVRDDILNTIR